MSESQTMNFASDAEAALHWRKGQFSKQLKSHAGFYVMDKSDAVQLFRSEQADLVEALPETAGWRVFRVRDEYAFHRKEVRELSMRLYKITLNSSLA